MKLSSTELMRAALDAGTVIPAFNIPYLPMMKSVVKALADTKTFGLIQVARLEWVKFGSQSMQAVRDLYAECKDERYTRLHLDHIPVIDEDQLTVDYEQEITNAIALGYESVMVDGSRLSLDENIAATATVAKMAREAGIPAEGELGAVMGHESGPMPPYDELFESGKGFTALDEAVRFVKETKIDWLSVAIGNIHGAISGAAKQKKKVAARLDLDHLSALRDATGVPLVLHGGSGIQKACLIEAFKRGIAKINIGTSIRQPYEQAIGESEEKAKQDVYDATVLLVTEELEIAGSADVINPQ